MGVVKLEVMMGVNEAFLKLEEVSAITNTSLELANPITQSNILLNPKSKFNLLLNLKVLLIQATNTLARCDHNMHVFSYCNTETDFQCLVCDIKEVEEVTVKKEDIVMQSEIITNEVNVDSETSLIFEDDEIDELGGGVFREEDIELINYQTLNEDKYKDDGYCLIDLLYPDVKIFSNENDFPKVQESITPEVIVIEDEFLEECEKYNDKLDLLKASGAITILTIAEQNENANVHIESEIRTPKAPMLIDPRLPDGWRGKVVDKKNGRGFYVKVYGNGKVFYSKKGVRKFVEENTLLIDPESIDFTVTGSN